MIKFKHDIAYIFKTSQSWSLDSPEESDAVANAGKVEVEVDGLGMTNVQHTVGLGRETRADLQKNYVKNWYHNDLLRL